MKSNRGSWVIGDGNQTRRRERPRTWLTGTELPQPSDLRSPENWTTKHKFGQHIALAKGQSPPSKLKLAVLSTSMSNDKQRRLYGFKILTLHYNGVAALTIQTAWSWLFAVGRRNIYSKQLGLYMEEEVYWSWLSITPLQQSKKTKKIRFLKIRTINLSTISDQVCSLSQKFKKVFQRFC